MSKIHSQSSTPSILHEIEYYSKEQLERIYNITIDDDGIVFDPTYNKTFASVFEWAKFEADQNEDDYFEMQKSSSKYDDFEY